MPAATNDKSDRVKQADVRARNSQSTAGSATAVAKARRLEQLKASTSDAERVWALAVSEAVLLAMETEAVVTRAELADAVKAMLTKAVRGQLPFALPSPSALDLQRKKLARKTGLAEFELRRKSVLAEVREAAASDLVPALLRVAVAGDLLPHSRESALDYIVRLNARVDSRFLQQQQKQSHEQQKEQNRQPMEDITSLGLQPTRSGELNAYDAEYLSSLVDLKSSHQLSSYQTTSEMVSVRGR